MKKNITIALCALFIAITGIVGCQKEEINYGSATNAGQIISQPSNYPNGCCCAHHGFIAAHWEYDDNGMTWVGNQPMGVISYFGCGYTAGSVASGAIFPTLPTGWSAPTDSMSLTFVPGMQYSFYQNNTLISTVYSDGNGNVDFSDLSPGTYNVTVYFDADHETGSMQMTLPLSDGWLVKLDELQ